MDALNLSRINMSKPWDMDYWTEELGVSGQELRKLIAKVGTSADAVRKELGMPRRNRRPSS